MQMTLFLNIIHKLSEISPYFTEGHDASGRIGLTTWQVYRCCVSISLWHGRRYDRWVSEVRKIAA
jgi:hypothetical protein